MRNEKTGMTVEKRSRNSQLSYLGETFMTMSSKTNTQCGHKFDWT